MELQDQVELEPAPAGGRPHWKQHLWFLGVAILVVALDQASKHAVRATMDPRDFYPGDDWPVRFHYVTNTGAAFGILEDQTTFLVITSLLGIGAILFFYFTDFLRHWSFPLALGMMLGGAASNLADRIRLGEVTDFIDFPNYPSFNVADSAIVIAIMVLVGAYAFLPAGLRRKDSGVPAPPA